MFDRKGFMAFVGSNSGASYVNGLDNIEKIYSVNIDEEIQKDKCTHLLLRIDSDKKKMSGNDRHNRQNWFSHLKKYVSYIDSKTIADVPWMPFYTELATKLLEFKQDRQTLLTLLHKLFHDIGVKSPFMEKDVPMSDVDPFTIIGCFNKGISNANRIKILQGFKQVFSVNAEVPTNFDGIPVLNNFMAVFFAFENDPKRGPRDISNLWDLFSVALDYADAPTGEKRNRFIRIFDLVKEQAIIRWNITMGLFWIRPYNFINLDERNRQYLGMGKAIPPVDMMIASKLKNVPSGTEYLAIIEDCKNAFQNSNTGIKNFVDLSQRAWIATTSDDMENSFAYWPSLEEYDPGIAKDTWKTVLLDSTVTDRKTLDLLYMFWELGGESTLANIVKVYDNQFYYTKTLTEFGWNVSKALNVPLCEGNYKAHSRYLIAFQGRTVVEDGVEKPSWKLRNELRDALLEVKYIAIAYWPSIEEYNPGISIEMWISVLNDRTVTTQENLDMLQKMLKLGGESTCAHLAEVFGKTHNYYNKLGSSFGEKVKKVFNCPDCPDREGDTVERNRVYVIPFVGRYVIESGNKRYSWKLRDELKEALMSIAITNDSTTNVGLNTILYGPPGTGKTYHTVIYAVAIIENKELDAVKSEPYQNVLKRYNEYKTLGQIEFTTFHQSYGYEEFIEGIRPTAIDENDETEAGNIQYSVQPGVFKKFCEKADCPISVHARFEDLGISENATIWKVSLWSTGDNEVRAECLQNNHIRIGWDQYGKDITDKTDFSVDSGRVVLNSFINKMQLGDIVFSCYSASTIDAIGIVTGEYEWHDEYEELKRVRKVDWLVKGIRENILALNGGKSMTLASVYRLSNIAMSDVFKIINKYQPIASGLETHKDNFVFIIDEINRGNISKIFGELITLIEESKRVGKEEGMKTLLPYSMKPFGIPENVYIIGTMNTADRSIATIDTALRRRFEFKEMLPDPEVVAKISVGNLSIKTMLEKMNRRIAVLYDREHTIGHAYFMPLAKDNSMEKLAEIFKNKVIPLLQEYFYEDYEKIRLVLADNQKENENDRFIKRTAIKHNELFGSADINVDEGYTYEINEDAFMNPEAYLQI